MPVNSRYSYLTNSVDQKGQRFYNTVIYPSIPLSSDDVYIVCNSTDRYDTLALTYYGDSSLWWIISIANNASNQDGLYPPLDVYIRIPQNYLEILSSFEILNSSNNNTYN